MVETGKWLINDKEDSLNYNRHYCSVCGSYASGYTENNPKFEDSIEEKCKWCGANLITTELYRGKEIPTKEYMHR